MSKWRQKERLKTTAVALVLCLNIGVDPPDVIKISPCARLECWVDPLSMQPPKALETIGGLQTSWAFATQDIHRWQAFKGCVAAAWDCLSDRLGGPVVLSRSPGLRQDAPLPGLSWQRQQEQKLLAGSSALLLLVSPVLMQGGNSSTAIVISCIDTEGAVRAGILTAGRPCTVDCCVLQAKTCRRSTRGGSPEPSTGCTWTPPWTMSRSWPSPAGVQPRWSRLAAAHPYFVHSGCAARVEMSAPGHRCLLH